MKNSTETVQLNDLDQHDLTESEREVTEAFLKAKQIGEDVGEDFGIGVIDQSMPNAFFKFLCYIISYNTSTSLVDVPQMSLFDFISILYIINEVNKQNEESMPNSPTPKGKMDKKMMGL